MAGTEESSVSPREFLDRTEKYRQACLLMMREGHKLAMMARALNAPRASVMAIDHSLARIDLDWCYLASELKELIQG